MRNKKKHRYLSTKKRRKRLEGELRSIFYSTEGMRLWHLVESRLRRAVPSPLYVARGCLLISVSVAVGLIVLVQSPRLWFVVAGLVLIALMIKTMIDMYQDMERERRRLRLKIKKERARAKARVEEEHAKAIENIEALKQELSLMGKVCDYLMWQIQHQRIETNAPENLTPLLVYNLNFNNMNFFGNVETNGGNIYGDNAVHNETHHHYGSENNTNSTEHVVEFPALPLLTRLVQLASSTSPKQMLMPYRAAREAGALLPPMPSVSDFNEQFGTSLSPTNYSTYITSCDNPYENDRDAQQFRTLKQQFEAFGKRE